MAKSINPPNIPVLAEDTVPLIPEQIAEQLRAVRTSSAPQPADPEAQSPVVPAPSPAKP
jgi:hypothetical protein